MDSHQRSIVKAITYRLLGTILTTVIAYVITGEAKWSAAIGVTDAVFKSGFFYLHERIWNRIHFGRSQGPDYEI